jgi:hypothetical protein
MAAGNLLAIIKAKQVQIAKLRAELEEAQGLLAKIVNDTSPSSRMRDARRRGARRRSSKMLEHSPTAHEAAKILRRAGRPLHATAITKTMNRNGHEVALGTVVSTLSRWVNTGQSSTECGRMSLVSLHSGAGRSGGDSVACQVC